MLHLSFSNQIDRLAGIMANFLRIPSTVYGGDLDESSTMIVHTSGRAYLKHLIAQNMGICANIAFESSVMKLFESHIDRVPVSQRPGTLLDEKMVFNYLYRIFRKKLYESHSDDIPQAQLQLFATSRAETMSRQVMEYVARKAKTFNLKEGTYPSGTYGDYVRAIVEEQRSEGVEVVLPIDWLGDDALFERLELPKCIFIFDPSPLTQFEIEFLLQYVEDPSNHLFISAFSPSTGFWYNATDGKKASEFKDVLGDGDLSSMKFDFVSLKGREIARDIDRSLLTLFMSHDENENPFESYDAKARDKRKNSEKKQGTNSKNIQGTNLQKIQDSLVMLDPEMLVGLSADCDSVVLRVFLQIRDEVRAVADKIVELVARNTGDGKPPMLFDDICVLIPSSVCDGYVSPLSNAFLERNIPFNMKQVVEHPVNQCYSAFKAYVAFLTQPMRRSKVLNFAFHEAVASPQEFAEQTSFVQSMDRLGIYGGDDESGSYSWAQGLERVVDLVVGSASEQKLMREPAIVDDDEAALFLRHAHRLMALFRDRNTTRRLRLSYGDWQTYFVELFGAWLRSDVSYRAECMKVLCTEMHRIWPADVQDECVGFDEVAQLLRIVEEKLYTLEKSSIYGGVQVQILDESVMTRRAVFILGQSRDAFPSKIVQAREFENYSPADMDEYAWNKWLLNATDVFWVSAKLDPQDFASVDDNISPLMRELCEVFSKHEPKIDMLVKSTPNTDELEEIASRSEAAKEIVDELSDDIAPENDARQSPQTRPETRRILLWNEIKEELYKIISPQMRGDYINVSNIFIDQTPSLNIDPAKRVLDKGFLDESFEYGQLPASDVEALDSTLPRLSWRALAELFQKPNETYRKYEFGIDEYNDYIDRTSYQFLAAQDYEPVEAYPYSYDATNCIRNILLHCFLTRQLSKFEEHLEMAASFLRREGAFPDAEYWQVLRHRAMEMLNMFQRKMEMKQFDVESVRYYRVVLKSRRPSSSKYKLWFDQTFKPDQTIVVDYENDIFHLKGMKLSSKDMDLPPVVFQGELYPIIDIKQKEDGINQKDDEDTWINRICVVDVNQKGCDSDPMLHLSNMTVLFATFLEKLGYDVPTPNTIIKWKVACDVKVKLGSSKIDGGPLDFCHQSMSFGDNIVEVFNNLYKLYKSRFHELNRYVSPGSKRSKGAKEPTGLSKYADSKALDTRSVNAWDDLLEKDATEVLKGFARKK